MSTTILAPTAQASGASTTSTASAYDLDAVIQASCLNAAGLKAHCVATLLLSADGTNYVTADAHAFPRSPSAAAYVASFVLANYANLAIAGVSPPWVDFKVQFAGNLSAGVTVGVVGDSGALDGTGSSITLTTIGTSGAATLAAGVLNIPTPAGGGSGTVTSVAMTMPAEWVVAGSPVTTAGTLAVTKATQASNLFYASQASGSGVPTFRAIVAADLPVAALTINSHGGAITTDAPSAGAVTCNLATSDKHQVTAVANTTVTFSNAAVGQVAVLTFIQGGSGSYTLTVSPAPDWGAAGAPTLSTVVGKKDILTFLWDGTTLYGGVFGLGF